MTRTVGALDLDITDLFCGAGGSGLGAVAAGYTLVMAANHWDKAIATHAANFPDTEHDCADISQVNPRRYRRTRVLWASPECTNHSQAKGKPRPTGPDLFGETLPDEAAERSRATMWDVPRFAEVHRYDAIIVENVVEAAKWVMFPAWLQAMELLGYGHQLVFLNSMHAEAIAAPRAPQSRDRMYVVFHRRGARRPDVTPRPLAWCPTCGQDVRAVQSWKRPGEPWGRYRAQYVYRCPHRACRFSVIEPYAAPAAVAIDWKMPGTRIGDRTKPLSPKTVARIEAGLRKFGPQPLTFETANGYVRPGSNYTRSWPVGEPLRTLMATETKALVVPVEGRDGKQATSTGQPMRTMTTRAETALVTAPDGAFLTTNREGISGRNVSVDRPMSTVVASPNPIGLVVPAGGTWRDTATSTDDPFGAVTTRETDALVVPYYGTAESASSADEPLGTLTTRDRYGVAFIAELRGGGSNARDVGEPLATVTASGNHHMLVRQNTARGNPGQMCTPANEPMRTLTTAGHQSLVSIELDVDDCTFRMLEPHEIQAAMAFHPVYEVLGNRREKVRQLGNGVTPPAAEFLLRAVRESLEPA